MLSNCGQDATASRRGPGQLCILLVAAAAVCVAASTANASQLIDRDAKNVKLAIDTKGEALITYTKDGQLKHVLVGGAIGALPPDAGHEQVKFWTDFSGGWGKHGSRLPVRRRLQALHGAVAPVARCRLQGARRHALGAAVVAAGAPRLRRRADGRPVGVGTSPLALVGIATGAADHDRLGVRRSLRPPLRQLHLRRHRRLRLQVDAAGRAAGRAGVAISTSTRTTRRSAPAGGATTASSRTSRRGRSATASSHTRAIPPRRGRSTARRSRGPE